MTTESISSNAEGVYASPSIHPRCLVYLLDLYLRRLPAGSKGWDVFYLRPAAKVPADPTAPWYELAQFGKEKLRTFVATMRQEAGIAPKSNHSLQATGATALFNAKVLKKIIRHVTGHRSNSLHLYEHPICCIHRLHQVSWCKLSQQWDRESPSSSDVPCSRELHTTAAG